MAEHSLTRRYSRWQSTLGHDSTRGDCTFRRDSCEVAGRVLFGITAIDSLTALLVAEYSLARSRWRSTLGRDCTRGNCTLRNNSPDVAGGALCSTNLVCSTKPGCQNSSPQTTLNQRSCLGTRTPLFPSPEPGLTYSILRPHQNKLTFECPDSHQIVLPEVSFPPRAGLDPLYSQTPRTKPTFD